MSDPEDSEDIPIVPVPPAKPPAPSPLIGFNADQDIDLRPALPSMAELLANGGRMLVTLALREMPYKEYLQTNHWQAIRARTYRLLGPRCTYGAHCEGPLDVHHLRDENRGDEPPEDVEILCRKHHIAKHEMERHVMRAQLAMHFNKP